MPVLKARIGGQWVDINTAAAPITVQEEGGALTTRSKLNFVGSRITAADDAANSRTNITVPNSLLSRVGNWSAAAQYTQGDFVKRYEAWWMTYTSPPIGSDPGGAVSQWEMVKGPALMTTAQRTTFGSAARLGDTVYDTDDSMLYVWNGAWQPSHPQSSSAGVLHTAYGTAINDATHRVLFDYTVAAPTSVLVHVTGRVEYTVTTSTAVEMRAYIGRYSAAGALITVPNGATYRAYTSVNATMDFVYSTQLNVNTGERVKLELWRQSGTGTYTSNQANAQYNGTMITEFWPRG